MGKTRNPNASVTPKDEVYLPNAGKNTGHKRKESYEKTRKSDEEIKESEKEI